MAGKHVDIGRIGGGDGIAITNKTDSPAIKDGNNEGAGDREVVHWLNIKLEGISQDNDNIPAIFQRAFNNPLPTANFLAWLKNP